MVPHSFFAMLTSFYADEDAIAPLWKGQRFPMTVCIGRCAMLNRQDRTLQLEEANRELEAFSYSVSHDLRAPLPHISGFASILKQECGAALDQKAKGYLLRIYDGTKQMAGLMDDLLRLAKLVCIDFKFQKVNLSKLAREIVARLEFRDPGRSVELLNVALENLFPTRGNIPQKKKEPGLNLAAQRNRTAPRLTL